MVTMDANNFLENIEDSTCVGNAVVKDDTKG
jgi:hypothetical protein